MEDLSVVTAGIPANDDCPILTRLSAFVVPQGVTATLEHVVRKPGGRPADLTGYVADSVSPDSSSGGDGPGGSLVLSVAEWVVGPTTLRPVVRIPAWAEDGASGLVRARLPAGVVEEAGIYELSWGVLGADGVPVFVSPGLLSVERSLYPALESTRARDAGPLTIQEVRLALADEADANFLLGDSEFSEAQILQALAEPVRYWNEALPPVAPFSTKNFPYRGAWLSATAGHLHVLAANQYRRNFLNVSAGGLSTADKDKERQYLAEGQRRLDEYKAWVANKKVSLNTRAFYGSSRSSYYGGYGW